VKELEQGLGLQAGAVKVTKLQMQKARYAEDVLRLGRHLMANVSATPAIQVDCLPDHSAPTLLEVSFVCTVSGACIYSCLVNLNGLGAVIWVQ